MKRKLISMCTAILLIAAMLTACSKEDSTPPDGSDNSSSETLQPELGTIPQDENGKPKWSETPISGQLYVNSDRTFARVYALEGSKTVKEYRLNETVTVVAKTDTNYYKLDNGSFIHADYLSETEIIGGEVIGNPPSEPATNIPQDENGTPKWSETPVSGQLYVNKDGVFARIHAIQGSTTVRQYKLNDCVTVVAKTNTDYYKLDNGSFIHVDYLSETETLLETVIPEDIPEVESEALADYVSVTEKGYVIERKNGITYVDGIMIANKTYTLPASYDPGIRPEAADALEKMQNAAAAEGLTLYPISAYRSYKRQVEVYAGWVNADGAATADRYSSRPGYSDHQTGYTYDLNSCEVSFANTAEGKWLAAHCAEFGFIIRYPEGKEAYTGYIYEPWHVRWIGVEKAKTIMASGLSLEEYYGFPSSYDISGDVFV